MKRPVLLILLILALAAGLLWQRHTADRPLDPVGAVSIAVSSGLAAAPVWIAQDHGLFARAGLAVTVAECSAGKLCFESMRRGEVNLATAAEFVSARMSFTERDFRILGTTAFAHDIKLQALKDRGIVTPADLKRKRIGVMPGSNGEYFLARLLTLNDMARDDITWVDVKPPEMADALNVGKVDAVLVWSPFNDRIRNEFGARLVEFDGQPGQDYYFLLMGQPDWLASHTKVAERVMLALTWANEWIAAHPDQARAYMATKFKLQAQEVETEMRDLRFSVGLPQTLLSALEEEIRWLKAHGAQGNPVANSLDLIAFEPLQAVAPGSVTMVRGRSGSP